MSILIPAGQLTQTIITIRCDSPSTAPQVECSLDENIAVPSHGGRTPSPSSTPLSIAGSLPTASADLNLQRGIDQRGHYIRLSFLPVSCMSQGWGQFDCMPNDNSYFLGRESLSVESSPARRQDSLCLQPASPPYVPSKSAVGIVERNPIQPCPTALPEVFHPSPANSVALNEQNTTFPFTQDLDLVSALNSFITDCDFSHNVDYLMCQPDQVVNAACPTTASSQQTDLSATPATPELSSSVASSSANSSPATPLNFFFPAPMDTDDPNGTMKQVSDSTHTRETLGIRTTPSPKLAPIRPASSSESRHASSSSRTSESRLLPCPQQGCRRQFKSTSTLSGHMKTHAGKGTRFPCSFPPCTEKFSRRHDQLRHEVYKHGKRCDWVCEKCNSFFSYERSLEKHTCTLDKSRRGSVPYLSATSISDAPTVSAR